MRRSRLLLLAAALVLTLGLVPASAAQLGAAVPVLASDTVQVVGVVPSASAISTAFSSDSPHMYVNTLRGIEVYDISNPRLPLLVGYEPTLHFQNEAVSLGERADGSKFVIVGFDAIGVTPTYGGGVATFDEIAVVEVTDPSSPSVVARLKFDDPGSAHTVSCVNAECTYAYSAGYYRGSGTQRAEFFSVIDLTDFRNPVYVGTQPSAVGYLGHDWDVDEVGIAWHVGWEGLAAYDVSDPLNPVVLNTSDENGLNGSEWNNFILHNSLRPNAGRFGLGAPGEDGPATSNPGLERARERVQDRGRAGEAPPFQVGGGSEGTEPLDPSVPHVENGNVLLVTEEDYIDTTCQTEGSFQTWHVPELDPAVNPGGVPGQGTVTPLDQWNTELLDSGVKTPAGAFCSAHYFDYHQDGFVAQGFYQQGIRILDVRDPADIKQVGYWVTGAQESWGAYWVPERDENGHVTGEKTNLIYTNDPSRGIEILEVALPSSAPEATADRSAPTLAEWHEPNPAMAARASQQWGYACPLLP